MKCYVCNSGQVVNFATIKGYYTCLSCGVVWMKKFPKSTYEEDYYQPKLGFAGKFFTPITKLLYLIRHRYVSRKHINVWVDVGAGDGNFLKTVKASKKIGVEISEAGRKMMQIAGIKTMTPGTFLSTRGLNADVISFWHVLEHLENPRYFLKIAERNLSPKGVIVVGVPNIDSWDFNLFKKHWFHLVPQYHLWHYSPTSIGKLLEDSGFKIRYIDYWSIEHHLAGLVQSFINISSGSHNVLHKLVKRETDLVDYKPGDLFWIFIWLTFGFPIILVMWCLNSVFHKSGTIVVVAHKFK